MTDSDKRSAILKAARELIAQHGFHGTPTATIAKKAGVGAGTLYRYFESKDELICAIHLELEQKLKLQMYEGLDERLETRERFQHLIERLMGYLLENPVDFRFLEQFYNSPFGAALRRDRILSGGTGCGEEDRLHRVIVDGQKEGSIKNLPLLVLHALAIGPVVFLVKDVHAGLLEADAATTRSCIEGCWEAIRTR